MRTTTNMIQPSRKATVHVATTDNSQTKPWGLSVPPKPDLIITWDALPLMRERCIIVTAGTVLPAGSDKPMLVHSFRGRPEQDVRNQLMIRLLGLHGSYYNQNGTT
jgi:hypothetical protein